MAKTWTASAAKYRLVRAGPQAATSGLFGAAAPWTRLLCHTGKRGLIDQNCTNVGAKAPGLREDAPDSGHLPPPRKETYQCCFLNGHQYDARSLGCCMRLPCRVRPGILTTSQQSRHKVLRDAEALLDGGVDGLMLENFGDTPFYPHRVPAITVATLTALACEVRSKFAAPLGINMLRNDGGQSALAVAIASGASFIRVNVLCGARVADQGVLQSIAHDLLRDRANLKAGSIQIWADVDVKHSTALAERPLNDEVRDLIDRAMADAVIVTGTATGQPIELTGLQHVRSAAISTPVVIGSGVTPESVGSFATYADGIIVGSSLKKDGLAANPIESERVKRLMVTVRNGAHPHDRCRQYGACADGVREIAVTLIQNVCEPGTSNCKNDRARGICSHLKCGRKRSSLRRSPGRRRA